MVICLTHGDSIGGRGGWQVGHTGLGEGINGAKHVRRGEGEKVVLYSLIGSLERLILSCTFFQSSCYVLVNCSHIPFMTKLGIECILTCR